MLGNCNAPSITELFKNVYSPGPQQHFCVLAMTRYGCSQSDDEVLNKPRMYSATVTKTSADGGCYLEGCAPFPL